MAKKFTYGRWLVGITMMVAGLFCAGCAGDPDQAALEATIAAAQAAAEEGEMGEVISIVAEDFVGQGGSYDRLLLRRMLLAIRLRHSDVSVSRVSTEYEVDPAFATVKMKLLLTGGTGVLPETGRLMSLETRWRVEDGQWRLTTAQWDGIGGL